MAALTVALVMLAVCGLVAEPSPHAEAIRVTPVDGAKGVRASGPLEVGGSALS
ncbi:hypothetical protein [Streptomyces gobiensis]|uniref:hypothetical protein n=1 Tax=Streptomyces gobiensis TaxID=2875706 RepID=UPI001E49DA68|nr:hypothetical protein [Streptomyces gobiensis]UGY93724.1 hypothetical protein test1122_19715 [Streptomyces gobiensis]